MGKVFTSEDLAELMEQTNGAVEIVIPEEFDEIDERAFYRSGLTAIKIPSTVKEIGKEAFSLCRKLEQVKFAEYSVLEKIGEYAFSGSSLTTIEIPSTVRKIGEGAFFLCRQLEQVKFAEGSSLEEIGKTAFYRSGLTAIKIPSTVKEIGKEAFSLCRQLEQVKFAEGSALEEIGENAFSQSDLLTIEIPSTVKEIGDEAFSLCRQLEQVKFAEGSVLEKIGRAAFYESGLTAIKIPSTVRKIAASIFGYCSRLQKVEFAEGSILEEIGEYAFSGSSLTTIEIPSTVRKIGECFFQSSALNEIYLPSSIKRISDKVFTLSNLHKVMFEKDAIIDYDYFNRQVGQLTIHTRNKELGCFLIDTNNKGEHLTIKYNNYQKLDEFVEQLNGKSVFYDSVTLVGKRLSIREKMSIKKKTDEIFGEGKTKIVFEKVNVNDENNILDEGNHINDKSNSVLSKENEELLGKIKNICTALPKDLQTNVMLKISSLLELYDKKIKEDQPKLSDYLQPSQTFETRLSMDGDLELWLFQNLLCLQKSLSDCDKIISDLKKLKDYRKLFELKVESKPNELSTFEDIIKTIIYLTGKVDSAKKEEVYKKLESYLKETEDSYNTKLKEMFDTKENKVLLGDDYTLPMADLRVKLLTYVEELSKYVIKVLPYLNLLDALKSEEVLEYKGDTNSICDIIIGTKYVIPLIKNQGVREAISKEFSSLCDEFIKRIEMILTKINDANANDYLNFEKELSQSLQPILEKLDVHANQNDYMTQLINCRDMINSNGEVELDFKKTIESYVAETYSLILKLSSDDKSLAQEELLAVIEKWINNMPEEKEGLNLLRDIYKDITEINFRFSSYLNAIENYEEKFKR